MTNEEREMTDEERRKLCERLRSGAANPYELEAADEIERLAALVQSDAEPVAWQYRIKQGGWSGWHEAAPTKAEALSCIEAQQRLGLVDEYELRPLYTAPPRPDASAEIAELHERCADAQWLACEWMARHDKVVGFISKNYPSVMFPDLPFPSPVSRPDASAGLIEPADYIPIGGAGNGA